MMWRQRANSRVPMLSAWLVWVLVAPAMGQPASTVLSTVAEVKRLSVQDFNVKRPLALEGVVTLADPERQLVIVQDDTGALALQPVPAAQQLPPGRRVRVEADDSAPYFITFPRYPFEPTDRLLLEDLDLQEPLGSFCLVRLRGWVTPPRTGDYTFWIAGDNSAQFWLSPAEDPTAARIVASISSGDWTVPYEWNRFPTQRSEPQHLEAGRRYYVEVLLEQQAGINHVSIAWDGPELEREIIRNEYLTPWPSEAGEGYGVLFEYWKGYTAATLSPINSTNPAEVGITGLNLRLTDLGPGEMPAPRAIEMGQQLPLDDQFSWIESEADVTFIARHGNSLTIELQSRYQRPRLHIENWTGDAPTTSGGLRVRFQGVCEAGRDNQGRLVPSQITAPDPQVVMFYPSPQGEIATAYRLPPQTDTTMGGYFFTRGVVTFSGRVFGHHHLYVQETLGSTHVDMNDFPLDTPLAVGRRVEIGGNMVTGKGAPGIQPMAVNVLGWQTLPVARKLSEEDSLTLRDGLWVEAEGVVRFAYDDGTLKFLTPRGVLRLWIGETAPEQLHELVGARLLIHGVVSLDLTDEPMLLVASPELVQVLAHAPKLPSTPQPIASLMRPMDDEMAARVRVLGEVTHVQGSVYYLQDATGAIKVERSGDPAPEIGSAVEVVGFRVAESLGLQLVDAHWQPAEAEIDIAPVRLTPGRLEGRLNHRLARVEAQVVSQTVRDGMRYLELRLQNQVFQAMITSPTHPIPPLEPGSTVVATGVAELELTLDDQSNPGRIRIARLLLPGSDGLVLLQGPPWWTWERMVSLIGVLLAVLLGTLTTIFYLGHRYARQRQARLAFAREIMASQESERRRIASSLHDSLGQDLLVIRNQANRALQTVDSGSGLRERLEAISSTTLQAINAVREITHNLRPYQLDRLGLTQAIQSLVRVSAENSQVEFACRIDNIDGLFTAEDEMHIYRIIQEALNNIIKHSQATEATVVVKLGGGSVSIALRDNGRGLSLTQPPANRGLGLSSMQERATILGGTMKTDSQPGQGMNLQFEIPLPTATK